MKRSKKRWAWTAQQRRPYCKQWYSRPDTAHWYARIAHRKHRSQTRYCVLLIRQGVEEGHIAFPYHHHRWLEW
jgi:hypothetical protein